MIERLERPFPPPESFHVLVVEAVEDQRQALCELVRQGGYRVSEAPSGRQALKLLEGKDIHVVITELVMSGLDGWGLLEVIKKKHPRVHVLVVTGYMTGQGEAILTDQRADGYLIKPVIPKRVHTLLRALLYPQNLDRATEVVAVDRDVKMLQLMEDTLSERGVYVNSFDNVRKAISQIRIAPPDPIITELALSIDSGFDLCRVIRSSKGITFTPILVITSEASPENVKKAIELRVNGFLAKPFAPGQLVEKVFHLLRQAGIAQARRREKAPLAVRY
jgi:DNA-binding response OmpR family regulator